jgi:pimeloyl-ACP methyl ester carboxylesterase
MFSRSLLVTVILTAWLPLSGAKAEATTYGSQLEGFDYPAPVKDFEFTSQGEHLHMAYMDVAPSTPNGRTVMLLHGKNFCGATWEDSIRLLAQAGYRVVVPDQIGFCKSSKSQSYQFSFQQLAWNTHALLASIGVTQTTVVGHSTGGMLGVRYALMFPDQVDQLVLVNPIGLEDWKAKGVPALTIDQWYERELQTTAESIRSYEKNTYYADHWRPDFERWVQMLAGMYAGPGRNAVAWDSARLYDMIYSQPVVYEFERLSVPTLLLIGDKDTTAIGKQAASPEVRAQIGHYPDLAKFAVNLIPKAKLVEFPDLGHAPQIQDPQAFHKALLDGMSSLHLPE